MKQYDKTFPSKKPVIYYGLGFYEVRTKHKRTDYYECAFIGNTDYKEICNVYNIKY